MLDGRTRTRLQDLDECAELFKTVNFADPKGSVWLARSVSKAFFLQRNEQG